MKLGFYVETEVLAFQEIGSVMVYKNVVMDLMKKIVLKLHLAYQQQQNQHQQRQQSQRQQSQRQLQKQQHFS